jgi:hypothetical protein
LRTVNDKELRKESWSVGNEKLNFHQNVEPFKLSAWFRYS